MTPALQIVAEQSCHGGELQVKELRAAGNMTIAFIQGLNSPVAWTFVHTSPKADVFVSAPMQFRHLRNCQRLEASGSGSGSAHSVSRGARVRWLESGGAWMPHGGLQGPRARAVRFGIVFSRFSCPLFAWSVRYAGFPWEFAKRSAEDLLLRRSESLVVVLGYNPAWPELDPKVSRQAPAQAPRCRPVRAV